MTIPVAANVDPALRERIAAALTGIGEEAGSVIARVAERAAGDVRAHGVYRVAHLDAVEASDKALRRPIDKVENEALEACIRAHLDAGKAFRAYCTAERPCTTHEAGSIDSQCGIPPMPEAPAPAHPSPAEMARAATDYIDSEVTFAAGVAAERARLRAILVDMAESGNADRTHVLALAEGLR